ncbi:unnamed protein product [Cuscuta campestris]|uniref:Uncharacterized protein n=1 Tax=Cuscuta campestris TaxID=132261 RepID=A0A484MSC6_9ASTE|nr:unnamed protein product [Cuscuta campestris]
MVNNMDHGLPKFSLLGYDDWKIMMEAHLYALHDCMWMVLEDGPLKIQMENLERNPAAPDVVQYIPKPKEKWDDRDCKKHNLDNVAKATIFKTLDPITFSKIKHLKTAMEIWQEKNLRLLRSLPTEWYTKATAMEEGRNLENYTVQGLLDELRTYEHELKKKKEEQVTPYPTALMTTPRISSSEGTCTRNCDTPSSSQPTSSKMENYDEEFAMIVKQFRKFKKFFKKADSIRRSSKRKPHVSDSPPESYLCYNYRKPGHWKSACPYPKVEKYGERERIEKKKKAMVAAESDESSSSSSDEEALVCMERRLGKSNHEDRWTMLEDDSLCLMAKDDADQEVTSQTSCSSSYSIPTSENIFDQFKKMMKDFEEINLKHSSLTEENKLLSEENLKLTESRKSQLNEITQLKTENESLSEKVKSLNNELGILKSQEAVNKLLETTKQKGRKGLGFDPSSSKRKGKTTFIPPKPTAKPNKQKGKEKKKPTEVPKKEAAKYPGIWYLDSGCSRHMTGDASLLSNLIPYDGPRVTFGGSNDFGLTIGLGNLVYKELTIQAISYVEGLNYNLLSISQFCDKGYSLEFCMDIASLKNISTNEVILTGKRIRNIYEVIWNDVKEACLISKGDTNLLWPSKHDHEILDLSDKDEEVNERDKMKPTEFIPSRSLPLKTSQRNPDSNSAEPTGNLGQPSNIPDHSNGDNSGNGNPVQIHPETPTTSVLQPEAEQDQPVNPNQHNLRWLRDHPPQQVIGDIQSGVRTRSAQQNLEAMLACFISQVEPKNIEEALADSDWINAMQEELNQFSTKKTHLNSDYKLVLELVIGCLECGSGGHADDITQKRAFIINALITKSKVNWAAHFFNSISKHLGKPNQKYLCQGLYIGDILESLGAASKGKKALHYLSSKGENRAISSTTAEESSSDNVLIMSLNKSVKRKQVVSPSPNAEAPQNLAPINLEEEEEFSDQGELQRKKKRKITSPSTSGYVNLDELKEKEPTEETSAHNRTEQLLNWDQQLKNEKIIKKCLEFEVDDEDPAVYKPVFLKTTEDQVVLTSEAQANMETTAEDFQIFPETSSAFETVLPEAAVSTPQKQNQERSNEELQQLLHSEALEILTNPCEITNTTETEIPEKSAENLEMSKTPETNEAREEQAVEAQRSSAETEKETQMAEMEASKSPVTNFHFHSSSIPTLPDEVPEIWTKKVQGLIESALASQHASFRQEIEQMEARHNKLIEKSEETHCSNLKEISKSVDKTLEILSLLSNTVSNTMETYASDNYLQLKEVSKIREQIANVTVSLQKQMSILQMDIRAALAVSLANQVVTKDYLKVIIDNQKEAHKLFRLLTTNSGNRKLKVVLQQHSPSLIPELPIAVKEGEVSYIPTHLNLTDLVLEAQRSNPENSTQRLSSFGLDGTEADHQITYKTLRDNGAELFLGDRIGEPQIAWDWIEQTARVLEDLNVPMDNYPRLASRLLRKEAYEWWKRTDESAGTPKPWTWAHFEWAFNQEYIPKRFSEERRKEFVKLEQGDMTLPEYHQPWQTMPVQALIVPSALPQKGKGHSRSLAVRTSQRKGNRCKHTLQHRRTNQKGGNTQCVTNAEDTTLGSVGLLKGYVSTVKSLDISERTALRIPVNHFHLPPLLTSQHQHDLHQVNGKLRDLILPKVKTNSKDELLLVPMP